jgi:hypothetical protein
MCYYHVVPLVEQELLTLPEHMSSTLVFSGGSCGSIFSFMCMCCRSLFVLLYFISYGHCVVCSFVLYILWPLCCLSFCTLYLMAIVLSVLLYFISYGHCVVCPFVLYILWPLCCLFFCTLYLMAIVLSVLLYFISYGHCVVCSFVLYILWPLCCLFFDLRILITLLVSSNSSFNGKTKVVI